MRPAIAKGCTPLNYSELLHIVTMCHGSSSANSGVGAGDEGNVSALQKFLICRKFRQNLKKFGQISFDIFFYTNESIFISY